VIDPGRFVDHLGTLGVSLYTGVPDSLLKEFGRYVMATVPRDRHLIAANEGGAVAIALGHHLRTGEVPLVYLQNSGFGNLINPLLSLADPDVYGVPMVVLVGWRGQPGVADEPQHVKQGRVMGALLEGLDIPWAVLPDSPVDADACMATAVRVAGARSSPYVVLVEKGTFAEARLDDPELVPPSDGSSPGGDPRPRDEPLPSREQALITTVAAIGEGRVIVSTTGMLSRELFEHRERSSSDGSADFLTVGGMGHASSIAFGIALTERDREVWCLDGDGALLMHLGGLAVIADRAPTNLLHVVFNNGVHDSVGGQPTSIRAVDVPGVARALGYRHAERTSDLAELPDRIDAMRERGGPSLLEIRVRPGNRPGIGRPTRTPAESKQAFMEAIQ